MMTSTVGRELHRRAEFFEPADRAGGSDFSGSLDSWVTSRHLSCSLPLLRLAQASRPNFLCIRLDPVGSEGKRRSRH